MVKKQTRLGARTLLVLTAASVLGLLLSPALVLGQSPPQAEWSAPPPQRSIQKMRSAAKLGRASGYAVKIKAVEVVDPRFKPFLVEITVTGEKSFGLVGVDFATAESSFSVEKPPSTSRWNVGLGRWGTDPNASSPSRAQETRSFNIEVAQARALATTDALQVTVRGKYKELALRVKDKELRKLQQWLAPRVEQQQQD